MEATGVWRTKVKCSLDGYTQMEYYIIFYMFITTLISNI
jgi:hypothetical protein